MNAMIGDVVMTAGLLAWAVFIWRALDNLHQRCLSLGRSVDLHTALLNGIVSHLRLSELERRTNKEGP